MLFDTLPENALDNIVRFFSGAPRAENWAAAVNLADILTLYGVDGALALFLLSRFTGVFLAHDVDISIVRAPATTVEYLGLPKGAVVTSEANALQKLPASALKCIETLIFVAPFSVALLEQCPNIRSLVLAGADEPPVEWAKNIGHKLTSLELCSDVRLMDCTNLHQITLNFVCRNDENHNVNRAMFWENLGHKLEKLSIVVAENNEGEISLVEKYCRNIKWIRATGTHRAANERISECIASYGKQLEYAYLWDMTSAQLSRIKSACPAARFAACVMGGDLRSSLDILGDQLKEISAKFAPNWTEEEGEVLLSTVHWDASRDLREASFFGELSISDIRTFMQAPKPLLTYLELKLRPENDAANAIISAIARGTSALKNIVLRCQAPPPGAFRELISTNKALSDVTSRFYGTLTDDRIFEILEELFECTTLRKIEINYDSDMIYRFCPRIDSLCQSVRHRRVVVYVCGCYYLK